MAADQQRPPVAPYAVTHAFRPQIAVYSTPDLDHLAAGNGLDNLARLLKPWEGSVERVTLRTSTFVSHVVPVLPLLIDDARDLVHTELDALFLDNLSESITKRVPGWLDKMDPLDVHDNADEDLWKEGTVDELTPWYSFYRQSLIDRRPRTEYETFGHPVACMLAVSTSNPEPLNAFASLYEATAPEKLFADRPWVDPNVLRYYVLVHDLTTGPVEDATALLEDVRRAYGLHVNLLVINAGAVQIPDSAYRDASQRPQPKPADFERYWKDLPTSPTVRHFESSATTPEAEGPPGSESQPQDAKEMGKNLGQEDVKRIKLFLREFVVQSLVPWLERIVTQLNEQLVANRKGIAGRLFSAGRRYFGSRPASPATGQNNQSAFDAIQGYYRYTTQEAQTRRLADLALMLADYRLAFSNYDIGRKDFLNDKAWRYYASATRMTGLMALILRKGLAGSLELEQYLDQASGTPTSSAAQLDALRGYALYYELLREQTDWLAAAQMFSKAASDIEELPSALMLEQAAMSMLRLEVPARRRFVLLMTVAALRYQRTGPRTLADRSGRQALSFYGHAAPGDWTSFRNHLARMLARQSYNENKLEVALQQFLQVRAGDSVSEPGISSSSEDYLDDLSLTWNSLGGRADEVVKRLGLHLPDRLIDTKRTSISTTSAHPGGPNNDLEAWTALETSFLVHGYPWSPGDEHAESRKAPASLLPRTKSHDVSVGEHLKVDLFLRNNLGIPVAVSELAVVFDSEDSDTNAGIATPTLPVVQLPARELTKVTVTVEAVQMGVFKLRSVKFRYHGTLLCEESLARAGPRQFVTRKNLLEPTYAVDLSLVVTVRPRQPRLQITSLSSLSDWLAGEIRPITLKLQNIGSRPLTNLRVLCQQPSFAWNFTSEDALQNCDAVQITNKVKPVTPSTVALPGGSLDPGASFEYLLTVRGDRVGSHVLRWLFVFEDPDNIAFSQMTACYQQIIGVTPSLEFEPRFQATPPATTFMLESVNQSDSTIHTLDITAISPVHTLSSAEQLAETHCLPGQVSNLALRCTQEGSVEDMEAQLMPYRVQIRGLLNGEETPEIAEEALTLRVSAVGPMTTSRRWNMSHLSRVKSHLRLEGLSVELPELEEKLIRRISPLFWPETLDIVVTWWIPEEDRHGWLYLADLVPYPTSDTIKGLVSHALSISASTRSEEGQMVRQAFGQLVQTDRQDLSVCPVSVYQEDLHSLGASRLSRCKFSIHNHSPHTALCRLLLSPLHPSEDGNTVPPVKWAGAIVHDLQIKSNSVCAASAAYLSSDAIQDRGRWQMEINCNNKHWRLLGSENLVWNSNNNNNDTNEGY